jgi:ferredoxin
MNFEKCRQALNVPWMKGNIMADRKRKVPENVAGPFYVDDTCIDCDQCRSVAPQFFARHNEGGYSYVYRQPVTLEEFKQAAEAMECPTESIGNDG